MDTDVVQIERRCQRDKVIMPVGLVADPLGKQTLVPATTLDISEGGLRIQTSIRLSVGELIHVQFEGESRDLRRYQVVWSRSGNALRPGQAGLRDLAFSRKEDLQASSLLNYSSGLSAA